MDVDPKTVEEVRGMLREIRDASTFLAKWEQRRVRDLTPKNGSNFNQFKLVVGANQMDVLNWPSGGGDDECTPILETVTIDVDWDFAQDPSSSQGAQAGLDTIDRAFLSVYWGTCSHRADFDMMRGTSVTVSGYKVLLKASYIQAPPIPGEGAAPPTQVPQPALAVRASLAPGTKQYGGIVGNARRSSLPIALSALNGGSDTSAKIEIPWWCKEIGFAVGNAAITTAQIDQFANANNAAVARSTSTIGVLATQTVARESFSNWLTIKNITANQAGKFIVIFYLGR